MDEHLDSGKPMNVYTWLLKNEISGPVAEFIAEKFRAIRDEVTHAIKKTNKDCVEAYSPYPPKPSKPCNSLPTLL